MKTFRSFIAIALNDKLYDELAQLQAKLKPSNADVKWVKMENIHLTLKFLGNITDEQIKKVKVDIKGAVQNVKSYQIHFAGMGAFPKLEYPRVIWVGMDEGIDETKKIYQALGKEKREFSPHLTLGRVRSGKNKQQLIKIIKKEKSFSSGEKLLIKEIILFKSILSSAGPTYEPIFKGNLIKI